jgi:putative ubiquitin-RnfH superfamily antitoxin RatB of RatAB toxin-antitoxin module
MSRALLKHCWVAYATPERQYVLAVELPGGACIGDALAAARRAAPTAPIPWEDAPVGIFGELRNRADLPEDGDRIELYRPLSQDPRERRRGHAAKALGRPRDERAAAAQPARAAPD